MERENTAAYDRVYGEDGDGQTDPQFLTGLCQDQRVWSDPGGFLLLAATTRQKVPHFKPSSFCLSYSGPSHQVSLTLTRGIATEME